MDVNEDFDGDSDSPVSKYNDIDDNGVLTPSKTDEEELFVEKRKNKRSEL